MSDPFCYTDIDLMELHLQLCMPLHAINCKIFYLRRNIQKIFILHFSKQRVHSIDSHEIEVEVVYKPHNVMKGKENRSDDAFQNNALLC